MGIVELARKESLPIWETCANHPFIKDLASGQLSRARYIRYMTENIAYLKAYLKIYAVAISKCSKYFEMERLTENMQEVCLTEQSNLQYLHENGLAHLDADMVVPSAANKKYSDFMLQTVQQGSLTHALMAILPCMLSYEYIGKTMEQAFLQPLYESHPFYVWIHEYTSAAYREKCAVWTGWVNEISQNLTEEVQKELIKIFVTSSQFELDYWNMCYQNNKDERP